MVCLGPWHEYSSTENAIASDIHHDCSADEGWFVDMQALYSHAAYRGPAGLAIPWLNVTSDDFHPNDQGAIAIAQAIEQPLSKVSEAKM